MKKIEDGGPAFPCKRIERAEIHDGHFVDTEIAYSGMSLRDWFAGQVIASVKGWHPADRMGKSSAEIAYDIADAMLEARDK